jgi:hypothetical protein
VHAAVLLPEEVGVYPWQDYTLSVGFGRNTNCGERSSSLTGCTIQFGHHQPANIGHFLEGLNLRIKEPIVLLKSAVTIKSGLYILEVIVKKLVALISVFLVFSLSGCGDGVPEEISKSIEKAISLACELQTLDKQKLSQQEKLAKIEEMKPRMEEMKAANLRIKEYSESLDASEKAKIMPEVQQLMEDVRKKYAGCR